MTTTTSARARAARTSRSSRPGSHSAAPGLVAVATYGTSCWRPDTVVQPTKPTVTPRRVTKAGAQAWSGVAPAPKWTTPAASSAARVLSSPGPSASALWLFASETTSTPARRSPSAIRVEEVITRPLVGWTPGTRRPPRSTTGSSTSAVSRLRTARSESSSNGRTWPSTAAWSSAEAPGGSTAGRAVLRGVEAAPHHRVAAEAQRQRAVGPGEHHPRRDPRLEHPGAAEVGRPRHRGEGGTRRGHGEAAGRVGPGARPCDPHDGADDGLARLVDDDARRRRAALRRAGPQLGHPGDGHRRDGDDREGAQRAHTTTPAQVSPAAVRLVTARTPTALSATPHTVRSQPWRWASLAMSAGTMSVAMIIPSIGT